MCFCHKLKRIKMKASVDAMSERAGMQCIGKKILLV